MSDEIRWPGDSTPVPDSTSRAPEAGSPQEPLRGMAEKYRAALEAWGVPDAEDIVRRAMNSKLADLGGDLPAKQFPPDPSAVRFEGELHFLQFVIHMNDKAVDLLDYSLGLFQMKFKTDAGWFWDAVLKALGAFAGWSTPGAWFDLLFSFMSDQTDLIRRMCDASGNNQVRVEGVIPAPTVLAFPDPHYVFGQQHHQGGGINYPPGQAIVAQSYNPATRQWGRVTDPGKTSYVPVGVGNSPSGGFLATWSDSMQTPNFRMPFVVWTGGFDPAAGWSSGEHSGDNGVGNYWDGPHHYNAFQVTRKKPAICYLEGTVHLFYTDIENEVVCWSYKSYADSDLSFNKAVACPPRGASRWMRTIEAPAATIWGDWMVVASKQRSNNYLEWALYERYDKWNGHTYPYTVESIQMTGGPAIAAYKNKLRVVHRGHDNGSHELWYSSMDANFNWSSDRQIPGAYTSGDPSLATYTDAAGHEKLVLVARGYSDPQNIYWAQYDEDTGWSTYELTGLSYCISDPTVVSLTGAPHAATDPHGLTILYVQAPDAPPPPPPLPAAAPQILVPGDHAHGVDPSVVFSGTAGADTTSVRAWNPATGAMIAGVPVVGGKWQFTSSQGPWVPGQHAVRVKGVNSSGEGPEAFVFFTVDAPPPAAAPQIDVPMPFATGVDPNVVFSGTAGADTASVLAWNTEGGAQIADVPVAGGKWQFTSSQGPWAPGLHGVSVKGVNNSGQGPEAVVYFTVAAPPADPPVITVPEFGETGVDPSVLFSGTAGADTTVVRAWDDATGHKIAEAPLVGGRWGFISAQGPWSPGPQNVTVKGGNSAGDGPPAHVSFTVGAPPSAAPYIAVPVDHATGVDPNVVFSGTAGADTTSVVARDDYRHVIANVQTVNNQWQFTSSLGSWAPGAHNVTVTGVNSGGPGPEAHVTFTVATPAGQLDEPVISQPANGQPASNPVVFRGTAQPGSTIHAQASPGSVSITDGVYVGWDGQWSFTSNQGDWTPGQHTAEVWASQSGHTDSDHATVTFTIA